MGKLIKKNISNIKIYLHLVSTDCVLFLDIKSHEFEIKLKITSEMKFISAVFFKFIAFWTVFFVLFSNYLQIQRETREINIRKPPWDIREVIQYLI